MNQFFKSVLVIVASLALVSCDTPVADCENGVSFPLHVQMDDCIQSPCEIERGSISVVNITFRAPYYIEGLRPEVTVIALGVEVDLNLDEYDGCNSLLNTGCPIDSDKIIRYQLQIPILTIYPTIFMQMKFTIYDENSNGLVCSVVAVRIV